MAAPPPPTKDRLEPAQFERLRAALLMPRNAATDPAGPKVEICPWEHIKYGDFAISFHHFGPCLTVFSALHRPTHAPWWCDLLGAHAYRVLIGACNSMLCPICGVKAAPQGPREQ